MWLSTREESISPSVGGVCGNKILGRESLGHGTTADLVHELDLVQKWDPILPREPMRMEF